MLLVVLLPGRANAQAECAPDAEHGSLRGVVFDEEGTLALPGVRVVVRWPGGSAEVESRADGRIAICDLPPDRPLAALATFSGFSSVAHEFSVASGETHEQDFFVVLGTLTRAWGEAGRIQGAVVDADTGQPVEAAIVGVVDRGYEALTNNEGRFVLEAVPAGPQRLELRHVAYGTQQASVEVRPGLSVSVLLQVVADPIEVEPLHVTVTGIRDPRLEIQGFYERREWHEKVGLGHFFTWEDIERRRPRLITHMIADLPSTRLDCSGSPRALRCGLSFVGIPRTAGCQRADVFLDGVNIIRSDVAWVPNGIDELVRPVEIAGVEVYSGPASMPAEFSGASGSCGAIVIWTK